MIIGPEYGTLDWEKFRCGKVTASRFGDALTPAKTTKIALAREVNHGMGKTALSYMDEVVASAVTGRPHVGGKSASMERGNDLEADAIDWYAGAKFTEVGKGRILQLDRTIVCATPDGFVDEDEDGPGILEVKCPDSKTHLATWREWRQREAAGIKHRPPEAYIDQVQGQLWVSERRWCDFLSYDDRFPKPMRAVCFRVYRDDEWMEQNVPNILAFAEQAEAQIRELKEWMTQFPEYREELLAAMNQTIDQGSEETT